MEVDLCGCDETTQTTASPLLSFRKKSVEEADNRDEVSKTALETMNICDCNEVSASVTQSSTKSSQNRDVEKMDHRDCQKVSRITTQSPKVSPRGKNEHRDKMARSTLQRPTSPRRKKLEDGSNSRANAESPRRSDIEELYHNKAKDGSSDE